METVLAQQSDMGAILIRIIISLILVVGLLYFFLKAMQKRNELQLEQKSWIRVHDYYSLGMNRGIYLMEIMSQVYVVAMTEGHVRILHEIDPTSEEWEELKDEITVNRASVFPFLQGIINKKPSTSDFQSQLNRQIQRSRRLSQKIKGEPEDENK